MASYSLVANSYVLGDEGNANNWTFAGLNLTTTHAFYLVGVGVQGANNGIVNCAINGTSLANLAVMANSTFSNSGYNFFGGTLTPTGSDSVYVQTISSMTFVEVDLAVWQLNGVSTTPAGSNSQLAGSTSMILPAAVGDFVFAATSQSVSGGGSNFSSPQAPNECFSPTSNSGPTSGSPHFVMFADWTANSQGISGSNFSETSPDSYWVAISFVPSSGTTHLANLNFFVSLK